MAFWIMLIWVFVIWYFFQDNMSEKKLCSDGVYDTKVNTFYCILLFSVPVILIGLRSGFIDTASYIREYESIDISSISLADFTNQRDHSKLFYGLEYLFKKYISEDAQVWIFSITLLHSFLLLRTFQKYSCDTGLSVVLFIISCLVCHWMCNGMRQFIAVVILFACTEWIIKNKWYFYIPMAVLMMGWHPIASRIGLEDAPWYFEGIHQSALIALLAFFCIQGKAFNKRVWAVVILLLGLILTGGLDDILNTSVENTTYAQDMEYVDADTGTTVFRAAVETVPLVMAFMVRKEIDKDNTPSIIKISANASAITSVLYIASVFTSGIYVGRLPIYTEVYNLILIPWLIKHPYKNQEKTLTITMLVLYAIYFYYQVNVVWKGYYQSEILGIGIEG